MIIPPGYKITPDIIELLAKIESLRIVISSQKIPQELKEKIQRVSLLNSSLFSARIEGNPLTLEEVNYTDDQKRKTEVFNLVGASNFIDKKIKKETKITKSLILNLHKIVMRDIGMGGVFRTEPSALFNNAGVAVYLTPPPFKIQKMLDKILTFVNSDKENFPLITALIAHLVFEKIHPFLDGNGRVGRLLIFAVLKSKKYDFGITIPFEKYLDGNKSDYYYHLDHGLKNTEEYLLFMMSAIYEESKNLLNQIESEKIREEDLYLLPPRQEEIYLIIKDHILVSFNFLRRRFMKVPQRTLRYDIKKLVEKGFLVKIGKTRGSFYKIAKNEESKFK